MSRAKPEQIHKAIVLSDAGLPADEICDKLNIRRATFYKWRKKYSCLDASDIKLLKELNETNRKLQTLIETLEQDRRILEQIVVNPYKKQPDYRSI